MVAKLRNLNADIKKTKISIKQDVINWPFYDIIHETYVKINF